MPGGYENITPAWMLSQKGNTMNENTSTLDTQQGVPALESIPDFLERLAKEPKDLEVQVERTQEVDEERQHEESVDPQNTVH